MSETHKDKDLPVDKSDDQSHSNDNTKTVGKETQQKPKSKKKKPASKIPLRIKVPQLPNVNNDDNVNDVNVNDNNPPQLAVNNSVAVDANEEESHLRQSKIPIPTHKPTMPIVDPISENVLPTPEVNQAPAIAPSAENVIAKPKVDLKHSGIPVRPSSFGFMIGSNGNNVTKTALNASEPSTSKKAPSKIASLTSLRTANVDHSLIPKKVNLPFTGNTPRSTRNSIQSSREITSSRLFMSDKELPLRVKSVSDLKHTGLRQENIKDNKNYKIKTTTTTTTTTKFEIQIDINNPENYAKMKGEKEENKSDNVQNTSGQNEETQNIREHIIAQRFVKTEMVQHNITQIEENVEVENDKQRPARQFEKLWQRKESPQPISKLNYQMINEGKERIEKRKREKFGSNEIKGKRGKWTSSDTQDDIVGSLKKISDEYLESGIEPKTERKKEKEKQNESKEDISSDHTYTSIGNDEAGKFVIEENKENEKIEIKDHKEVEEVERCVENQNNFYIVTLSDTEDDIKCSLKKTSDGVYEYLENGVKFENQTKENADIQDYTNDYEVEYESHSENDFYENENYYESIIENEAESVQKETESEAEDKENIAYPSSSKCNEKTKKIVPDKVIHDSYLISSDDDSESKICDDLQQIKDEILQLETEIFANCAKKKDEEAAEITRYISELENLTCEVYENQDRTNVTYKERLDELEDILEKTRQDIDRIEQDLNELDLKEPSKSG